MKAAARLASILGLLAAATPAFAAPIPAVPLTPPPDITLDDCLRIAIDHNPQLRAASEQFLAAKGQALRLHAILYPTLNTQILTEPTTIYVQINQVLYSRATYPQLRVSRLAQDQAVINYRQTLTDVVFRVRQAFVTALGARLGNDLVRDFVSSQSGALASAQQLFEAGKIQKSAVLSVQVTGNLIAQRQDTAQLSVSQSIYALDNLLGRELPPGARLIGDFRPSVSPKLDLPSLIAEALRDRADLALLESLRLSQQQQILVDLRNTFPVVGAESNSAIQPPEIGPISNFDLERNYDEPEIQRQEGNTQLPLSLYFTWVIFDGGNLAGVRATDQAQLETQEVAVNALRHSIPGEVTAAVAAVQAEQETLRGLQNLDSPQELRHSAELDYQAGRIRQLDLVNLETDLLGLQQLQLASEIRLSLAMAALDHALGHGLSTKPSPGAP